MRGKYGPVALGSKLVYILSGPTENFKIMLRRTISLVFILCVLKQSSLIVILFPTKTLKKKVLGNFNISVNFKDGRYEVSFPFKESHLFIYLFTYF